LATADYQSLVQQL